MIGHADRCRASAREYCTGLMMPCERKSVEPMAAVTRLGGRRRSISRCCISSARAWSDENVLAKVREMVLPAIERRGPMEAWIIDDTGFPKKGEHSVWRGTTILRPARQAGQLPVRGIAVALPTAPASLPVGLPSVSAEGLGAGQQTAAQDGRA